MKLLLSLCVCAMAGMAVGQTSLMSVHPPRMPLRVEMVPCSTGYCELVIDTGFVPPEAEDVEAIKAPVKSHLTHEVNCNTESGVCFGDSMSCSNNGSLVASDDPHELVGKCINGYKWTCADPKRGLWHDEQTPAKFWCRKPQTEPRP